ncbi:SymE family type I addiction module toxin [Scandinavium sp. NPDC088450]|uniref:SymE family type I addiction module toxin n=1 Tax=Scandinavium sp. NPDC088450 TaxID=3364514 RepID=UPI00384C60F3
MAGKHSTSDRSVIGTSRRFIVGYRPRSKDRTTPNLVICGKWMNEAGFTIGHHIAAKVMDGCIVLVADSPKEKGLIEELREAKKALAEIQDSLTALQKLPLL